MSEETRRDDRRGFLKKGAAGLGLFMAAIFPTVLLWAARRIPLSGSVTRWFFAGASLGAMLYASTGFATLLLGGNFLDYDVLADDPIAGQHLGILIIELGVGITVSAVMLMIFFAFAGRARP